MAFIFTIEMTFFYVAKNVKIKIPIKIINKKSIYYRFHF